MDDRRCVFAAPFALGGMIDMGAWAALLPLPEVPSGEVVTG